MNVTCLLCKTTPLTRILVQKWKLLSLMSAHPPRNFAHFPLSLELDPPHTCQGSISPSDKIVFLFHSLSLHPLYHNIHVFTIFIFTLEALRDTSLSLLESANLNRLKRVKQTSIVRANCTCDTFSISSLQIGHTSGAILDRV